MDCGGGGVQRLVSGPDNSIRDVVQKRGMVKKQQQQREQHSYGR